jgi:hypothetical protein
LRVCSIDGCNEKHEAKGYCKRHYRSYYKYGDPLYIENNKQNKMKIPYEENHKIINGVEYKKCKICNEWFPMNEEYFYKNKTNRTDGYHTYCKECTKEKTYKWQAANIEKKREHSRIWHLNPERREKIRSNHRKYKQNGGYKKWQQTHPEKIRKYRNKRQHKIHEISNEEWESCKRYFNYSCAYCGMTEEEHKRKYNQQLHKEHVEHEGANDLSNCVPACKLCNSSKWETSLEEWYTPSNKHYNLERLNKILKWLNEDYLKFKTK